MPTVTASLVGGDWESGTPVVEVIAERCDNPEWHSLRLFGPGRRPGVFASGAETLDWL
jgi:hypothetical protein